MAASRRDIFRKLQVVEEEMDRLFSHFISSRSCHGMGGEQAWHPPTDVFETDEAVMVCMEIPGVEKDDIEITWHENILTVRGVRHDPCKEQKTCVHLMEINFGHFHRRIVLPFQMHEGSIVDPRLVGGFLHLRVLKPGAGS